MHCPVCNSEARVRKVEEVGEKERVAKFICVNPHCTKYKTQVGEEHLPPKE